MLTPRFVEKIIGDHKMTSLYTTLYFTMDKKITQAPPDRRHQIFAINIEKKMPSADKEIGKDKNKSFRVKILSRSYLDTTCFLIQ